MKKNPGRRESRRLNHEMRRKGDNNRNSQHKMKTKMGMKGR